MYSIRRIWWRKGIIKLREIKKKDTNLTINSLSVDIIIQLYHNRQNHCPKTSQHHSLKIIQKSIKTQSNKIPIPEHFQTLLIPQAPFHLVHQMQNLIASLNTSLIFITHKLYQWEYPTIFVSKALSICLNYKFRQIRIKSE